MTGTDGPKLRRADPRWARATRSVLIACALTASASAFQVDGDVALETSVTTVIGEFIVDHDEDKQVYALVLNGKRLVENEYSPIYLSPLLKGKGQDFLLVYKSSGGIACPGMFHALRVKSPVVLSEEFGTCTDTYKARVEGDRLVVTMSTYVAHPDLLEKSELARMSRTEVVYTYVDGLLSEREVVRPPSRR